MDNSERRPVNARFLRGLLHDRLQDEGIVPPDAVDRTDLVFNLTRFWNRFGQDSESVQRGLGWSWAGFRIMNLLWAAGPLEARQIGVLSGASRATISSLLGTLERGGLVIRDRSYEDRRQVLVRLTEDGHARLREGLVAQAERDRAWLAVLAPEEQTQLNDLLRKLAEQPAPD